MSLLEWHRHNESIQWRLVAGGIETEGAGIERTVGKPATATRVWQSFAPVINEVAEEHVLPCELIVATICTESRGNPKALRLEPGFVSDEKTPHRVSPGLMQTLISTARMSLRKDRLSRADLFDPGTSIRAGTAYIAQQRTKTNFDPPLVAAAYNAGGLYANTGVKNRWKLRQYPIGTGAHCDRFVKFYNDAVVVLAAHKTKPTISHADFIGVQGC
jgi:Transglycosylase SLT domain